MKRLLLIWMFALFLLSSVQATQVNSSGSGNWNAAISWVGQNIPTAGDTITINASDTITLTADVDLTGTLTYILVSGTLDFGISNSGNSGKTFCISLDGPSMIVISNTGTLQGGATKKGTSVIINNVEQYNAYLDGTKHGPFNLPLASTVSLPVTLTTYNFNYKTSVLEWRTASEENNDFFTLNEINQDGTIVESYRITGQGNSNTLTIYSHKIKHGDSYVLLYQTDYDGAIKQLFTFYIRPKVVPYVSVYPNPSDLFFTIRGSYSSVNVYDINGAEVNFKISKNILSGLKSGTYFIVFDGYHVQRILVR